MNHLQELLLTGGGAAGLSKLAEYAVKASSGLGGLSKNRSDRQSARETAADAATKTALDALEKALNELRRDVEAEKGKRAEAEENVKTLHLAVEALAERIEEQKAELAAQPKLKLENQKLRRQVGDLQKQVGELKSRIADLEQTRAEQVALDTEIIKAQDPARVLPDDTKGGH